MTASAAPRAARASVAGGAAASGTARSRSARGAGPVAAERPTAARRGVTPPAAADAEARLLDLARRIGALRGDGGDDALGAALRILGDAWAPDGALAPVVFEAWLRGRASKTAALALAWAREQVRLSLRDVIERAPGDGPARLDADAETLAWLLLAASESMAHEPPAAAGDRVRTLLELAGHVPRPPAGGGTEFMGGSGRPPNPQRSPGPG